jgi:predicted PurR-regulated permease PerM
MNKVSRQILVSLLYIALALALVYALYVVRYTLIYILISALVSLIAKPIVDLLSGERYPRLNLGRSLAAILTLLFLLGLIIGVIGLFIPSLMHELQVLKGVDFEKLFNQFKFEIQDLQYSLGLGSEVKFSLPSQTEILPKIGDIINVERVTDTFTNLVGGLGNLAFALFSILFISFFFLREQHLFRTIIMAFVPARFEARVKRISPRLRSNLSRYFVGLLIQITIITTLVSLGLKLGGFHNTIVIGFFAGLINVIPYLGPVIGLSFGIILGMAQTLGDASMEFASGFFIIIGVFAFVQVLDNFITQPIIFSTSIRAHPLEIFLVISFAAALAGIAGMIVAVPVYSVVRLLAGEFLGHIKFIRWLIPAEQEIANVEAKETN